MFEKLLGEYWETQNLEELTKEPDENENMLPPKLLELIKKEVADVFNKLGEEIKEGKNAKYLKEKYAEIISKLWWDLSFLSWGGKIPRKISKELTKKEREQAKGCLVVIGLNSCYHEMHAYAMQILDKYKNNQNYEYF